MKKNLRLLCLGLAAAAFSTGFAQVDKTSLLKNADMEQGLKGWAFDGQKILGKNTKNVHSSIGFHGMADGVLEAWNGDAKKPLGNSYIMQRLGGLESGTYVFGAYVGAAKQNNRVVDEETKKVTVWENRDSIKGVSLFANNATVQVATENPDMAVHGYKWAHSSKFNVAVTLTDNDAKKGYLDVGLRVDGTNANYVVWDNATLYYFADKNEAEALDAMAAIDMATAAGIADTLVKEHMNADTLTALNAAIAEAKKGTTTAATLWQDSENLHYAMGLARKSAVDYVNLAKSIEAAKVVAAGTWRPQFSLALADLNGAITEAEAAYAQKKANRKELNKLRTKLSWYSADVKYDSLYIAKDALLAFIAEAKLVENERGGYTTNQIQRMEALNREINRLMANYDEDYEMAGDFEDRKVDPNPLMNYTDDIYEMIANIKSNGISSDYTVMPIQFVAGENKWIAGATLNSDGQVEYNSPLYQFEGKIEVFRITVEKSANNWAYFCISTLEFFDGAGNPIELHVDSLSTNADHNALNPESPDGDGLGALIDGDPLTYFHSAWQNTNKVQGAHYLEVRLPNGGYDAFGFKMVSRKGQNHQFPSVMTISTLSPKRDALVNKLAEAKALNAYTIAAPGFYESETSFAVADLVLEIEAKLKSYPSESECEKMTAELEEAMKAFENAQESLKIRQPEAGKKYHIVNAFTGFYEQQGVEKALTVNLEDNTLWWETLSTDSELQLFEFELIGSKVEFGVTANPDGSETSWEKTTPLYGLKNVETGLYLGTYADNRFPLVEKTQCDSIILESLGAGQWNLTIQGAVFHCADHNSGYASERPGNFQTEGSKAGVTCHVTNFRSGAGSSSAWFIREMPELPLNVTVSGEEFKSECYHFQPANTITLTADKACAFEGLSLSDLYGNAVAVDTIVYAEDKAIITTEKNIVACAFEFKNTENVTSVTFNASIPNVFYLQKAYDEAVAFAPTQGDSIGQYADITAYTTALVAAEELLAAESATDAAVEAAIEALAAALEGLTPNMPESGKYYFVYSAVEGFFNQKGYLMALSAEGEKNLCWGNENYLDWNQYWQFEEATKEQLVAAEMDETLTAYFLKNIATGKYVGELAVSDNITEAFVSSVSEATPFVITMLGNKQVAFDGKGSSGSRLHANYHGGGAGNGSNIIYYPSGYQTASAWYIVETEYDATNIDVIEVSDNKVVVKGIYDLFGRRVDAATAPGIYIINGKKTLVK